MATSATSSISVFELLEALRRRKFYVIVPVLLLTAGFGLFAYTQQDQYRAIASLAAKQTTPPEFLRGIAAPPLNMQDHLWTVREILYSPPILETAMRQTKKYRDVPKLSPQALEEFKKSISIKVDGEHTFQVAFEGPDRYETMNVTNKLAELFVQQASVKHEQKNEEAASVITEQINELTKRLEQQGKQLHDYKSQNAHALPEHVDDNFRAADDLKAQLRDRATKIAEEEARRTAIQKQIQDLESKGILDDTNVYEKSSLETKLDDLKLSEADLETRYTPKHPELIKIRKQIAEVEKAIAADPKKKHTGPSETYIKYVELKSELDAIRQRIDSYRKQEKEFTASLASVSSQIEATPQHERVIEDMKREYDVGEKQFHALLDKQLDAKLAEGLATSESGIAFAVIEPASLPAAPYSPQRIRLVLMGLAAGLAMGFALTFVLEQNDTTFGTVDEFQAFTTLPVLGVIPNITTRRKGAKNNPAAVAPIVTVEPDSVAAEQYRLLALKLRQQSEAADMKVVMITSSAGAEGKSMTALNIAAALAPTVQGKVLLVDADMRKPRMHEYLGLTVPAGRGFHNLLLNPDDTFDKYVQKTKSGVSVILGTVPLSNPVAALSSPKIRWIFERLKQEFAIIIIDAPPTLPIADSHILSGLSDKVVFVVRARQTPRELFQHAVESFDAANVLGAVLNDVDYQRSRYAYAYEYYKKAA